jgi:hypothetical protein
MSAGRVRFGVLTCATAIVLSLLVPAFAQDESLWFSERWPPVSPPKSAPATPPSGKAAVRANLPDAENMLILIRTSLLTINDAILTGNFTVLRDRVAPSVRDQNAAPQLYRAFARLIEQKVDLRATSVLAPEMTDVPAIDDNGRLNLKGVFRAPDGTRLSFHLLFEKVRGQWLLYGASVNTVPATNLSAAPPTGTTPQPAARRATAATPPRSALPPAGRN